MLYLGHVPETMALCIILLELKIVREEYILGKINNILVNLIDYFYRQ